MRALITGANRGIGFELAKLYASRGYKIWALCRTGSPELKSFAEILIDGVDVANPENLKQIVATLPEEKIDVLINNAGMLVTDNLKSVDPEDIRHQFEVNTLGPLNVTKALLGHLQKGSKIGLITSRMGSMADNSSGGYYGYRASKAALNAIGKSLALDLKKDGIAVALLHPGYVQTRMTGFQGEIDAETSAQGLMKKLDDLNLENSGGFWHTDGSKLPW